MSIAIESVTIGGVEDRRLYVQNANIGRYINIGTNWSRLRIGIRAALDDSGVNVTGTPRLYLGVLSNPAANMTNGPLTNGTSHFVGMITASSSWVRSAGPPAYYTLTTGVTASTGKKIGSTITGSNITVATVLPADPTARRVVILVDILKGSPNFTVSIAGVTNAVSPADVSNSDYLKGAMEISLLSGAVTYLNGITGNTYNSAAGTAFAVDEATNGSLNAVCLAFDRSSPGLHVSDLFWAKMA